MAGKPTTVTATGSVTTTPTVIQSIVVFASADAWVLKLDTSSGGDSILNVTNALANQRIYTFNIGPTAVSGIYATTLTNITRIHIFAHSKAR